MRLKQEVYVAVSSEHETHPPEIKAAMIADVSQGSTPHQQSDEARFSTPAPGLIDEDQCGCLRSDDGECGCVSDVVARQAARQRHLLALAEGEPASPLTV